MARIARAAVEAAVVAVGIFDERLDGAAILRHPVAGAAHPLAAVASRVRILAAAVHHPVRAAQTDVLRRRRWAMSTLMGKSAAAPPALATASAK